MILKQAVLAIFISITSINAMAIEWEKIIESPDSVFYVDTDSFDNQQGKPSLMIKSASKKSSSHQTDIKRYEFDCAKHLFRVLETKKAYTTNSQVKFLNIKQGSTEQQIESLACQIHQMVGGV